MNVLAGRSYYSTVATKRIGRYEIREKLGKGGMGVVFKAFDPELDRFVAIKLISPDIEVSEEILARFLREARSAAKFSHANVVSIYDVGEMKGHPYIVMEYVEGQDLRELIEAQAFLPFERKIEIVAQICRGLAYAHRFGVVHRDINPKNVRISKSGEVKILDFGIARIDASEMTRTNQQIGTPAYMSPEQVDRSVDLDGRSDLFSLGVILFQLITGHRPFEADTISGLYFQIISQPVDLALAAPACSPELAAITEKALAKSREDRFADGDEMAEALIAFKRRLPDEAASLLGRVEELIGRFEERLNEAARLPLIPEFYDPSVFQVDLPAEHADDYGTLLQTYRRLQGALQLEAERRQQVNSLSGLQRRAQQEFDRGRAAECLQIAERMLEICPAHARALQLRKLCQEEARQQEQRQQRIEAGLALARQTLSEGDELKCLRMLAALREHDPDHPSIEGLQEEAAAAYEARIQDLLDKAAQCEQDRDYQAGLRLLQRALESDPEHPQLKSAAQRLEKAAAEQVTQLIEEARRLEKKGEYQKAFGVLDTVPTLGPDHPEVAALRQRLQEAQLGQQLDQLLQQARRSLESGDRRRCRQLVKQGLKLDPRHPGLHSLLSELDAAPERTQVAESAEANLAELLASAKLDFEQGRREQALRNAEFILALDPGNRGAQQLQERIASPPPPASVAPQIQETLPVTPPPPSGVGRPLGKWMPLGAASLAVLLLAVVIGLIWPTGESGLADARQGALILQPVPWARVESVLRSGDNAQLIDPSQEVYTPCRLAVPPGEYRIRLSHPDYEALELTATVASGSPFEYAGTFPGFDLEEEIRREVSRIQQEGGQ